MSAPFVYTMRVRFRDTDAQGHTYFANYLVFCDEAWGAYMREIGCPWQGLAEHGLDMYYKNATCDYSGSAVYEDDVHIETRVGKIGNTSMMVEFTLRNDAGETLSEASLTSVCVNPKTRETIRVPDFLREAVARYQEPGHGA